MLDEETIKRVMERLLAAHYFISEHGEKLEKLGLELELVAFKVKVPIEGYDEEHEVVYSNPKYSVNKVKMILWRLGMNPTAQARKAIQLRDSILELEEILETKRKTGKPH